MDEIRELQRKLAAVQLEDSAHKLSDRNVVDLIMKLQEMQLVELIYTLNGKELVTPKQLRNEIKDEVVVNNGRIALSEIQNTLNVDISYIEREAQVLVEENDDMYRLGSDLFTEWYLDDIMQDVDESLQASGQKSLGEIAQQYDFTVDFTKSVVTRRLASRAIKAQLNGSMLYTDTYMRLQIARMRGVFSAISRPTMIPSILSNFGFDSQVAMDAVEELIRSGQLHGSIHGREYTPFAFVQAQKESIYSFFQQNQYLLYSRAEKMQVTRPYEFVKKRFPDCVKLNQCIVTGVLVAQVEGSIESAIHDETYVDIRPVVPMAISDADVATLLMKLIKSNALEQMDGTYAVSKAFMLKCLGKFRSHAIEAGKVAAKKHKPVAVAVEVQEDWNDEEDTGRKSKRSSRKSKAAAAHESDDDSKKSSKKKKGGKNKKNSKKAVNTPSDSVSITPSIDETIDLLTCWFEDLSEHFSLAEALASELQAKLDGIYSSALTEAMSSIHKTDAAMTKQLREKFEALYDQAHIQLTLIGKGLAKLTALSVSSDLIESIEQYILDIHAAALAELITAFACQSNLVEFDDVDALLPDPELQDGEKEKRLMRVLSPEQKVYLEKELPNTIVPAVIRSWTLATAGRRSLDDFLLHLQTISQVFAIPLKKLDRKTERQAMFFYRRAVCEALNHSIDPQETFRLFLMNVFQQIYSIPIDIPCIPAALVSFYTNVIVTHIPEELMPQLDLFISLIKEGGGQQEEEMEQLMVVIKKIGTAADISKCINA